MATVTFTTQAANAPTYRGASTQIKVQSFVSTATFSVGDVYVLNNIKLPHRAIVTRISVKGGSPDGTYSIDMGTVGSAGTLGLFGSRSFSAALSLTDIVTSVPATISVSDDAAERYQTFAIRVANASTSGTTSVSLQFVVQYYCP